MAQIFRITSVFYWMQFKIYMPLNTKGEFILGISPLAMLALNQGVIFPIAFNDMFRI